MLVWPPGLGAPGRVLRGIALAPALAGPVNSSFLAQHLAHEETAVATYMVKKCQQDQPTQRLPIDSYR